MENDFGQWLPKASAERLKQFGRSLKPELREELPHHFSGFHAHPGRQPPDGDWRTWLIMAGRGFGKTRAGAEWVRAVAEDGEARIALVAATLGEARSVMVEGESGLLACCPPTRRPVYEPSLRKVTFANGAQAFLYGANEPEALRGPQHIPLSRAKPTIRRARRPKASAGWSATPRPAPGPTMPATWRRIRRAAGSSQPRATGCACSTAGAGRTSATSADGSGRRRLPNPRAAPRSMSKRGSLSPS